MDLLSKFGVHLALVFSVLFLPTSHSSSHPCTAKQMSMSICEISNANTSDTLFCSVNDKKPKFEEKVRGRRLGKAHWKASHVPVDP